jgi:hypothetical protein
MGKYTFWLDGQVVDGAGRTLDRHAATLADKLKFSAEQRALVVAELRNALVPTLVKLEDEPESRMRDIVGRGVERVLQLADAIDRSVSGADVDWYAVSYCAPVKWCSGSAALEGYGVRQRPGRGRVPEGPGSSVRLRAQAVRHEAANGLGEDHVGHDRPRDECRCACR